MTLTTRLDGTPQVDFYGGSLAASVGRCFAGVWRPEWPSWFEAIGWRTRARLHASPEPFIEQVWLKDGEYLRVYDRLVIPVGDGGSRAEGWISFIDNRRHLRSAARAGLIVDH